MDSNDLTIQPKPSSGNRCYTVQDLQDILGVGRKSVYSLLKRNEFRWIRVGAVYRIPKNSFDEWLESGNSKPLKKKFFHKQSWSYDRDCSFAYENQSEDKDSSITLSNDVLN